jgi:hypothetical protein
MAGDPAPQEPSVGTTTRFSKGSWIFGHPVLDISASSLSLLIVVEAKHGDRGPASTIHHKRIQTEMAEDVDGVVEHCGPEASIDLVGVDYGSEKICYGVVSWQNSSIYRARYDIVV